MISFTPTDEQRMMVDTIRRYAANEMRAVAHEADEENTVPEDVLVKGWELGILPGLIPEEYGGFAEGPAAVTGALALEDMAWGDLSIAMKIMTPALFAIPILVSGTDAQKQEHLPVFCDTVYPLATAALIEPSVTFDPWRPTTTATIKNGKAILEGVKTYVPMAVEAERMIVYARDNETGKVDGYIVERDTVGLEIGERNKLMGLRALPTYLVTLSGAEVSLESRVGGEKGTLFRDILNRSRVALAALAVGVSRASFEYARDYAKERIQFGVPIGTKQAIAFMLADVAIEIDAARLMVWEAAWQVDQENDATLASSLTKHYTNSAALFATDAGVQVLGGHGYIREHPVERWLRNARGFTTFDGMAII